MTKIQSSGFVRFFSDAEAAATARQIVPAQDASAVNMVWSIHLHVANAEARRACTNYSPIHFDEDDSQDE